jgi:hypothetical protein
MARLNGRIIRPSSLSERRVLKSLGVDFIRVPRNRNPFILLRKIRRLGEGRGGDLPALKALLQQTRVPVPVLPDSTTEPRSDGEQGAA